MVAKECCSLRWGPPAGRVEQGEGWLQAVRREVYEETGLRLNRFIPVDVWRGNRDDTTICSLIYVAPSSSEKIQLSSEHQAYQYVDIRDVLYIDFATDFDVNNWPRLISIALFSQ